MRPEDSRKLVLKWPALLIALLPIMVFAATDWLLNEHGQPNPILESAFASQFDGHAEAAGRVYVLATFILVVAGALAACLFFARAMLTFPEEPRRRLLITYIAAIVAGLIVLLAMNTSETQAYMGPKAVCAALSPTDDVGRRIPPLLEPVSMQAQPGAPRQCAAPKFKLLRDLLFIERNLLILAVAALALGSISCLALPLPGSDRRFVLRVVKVQAERLQRYLYLSATLLVMGLLFLGAFLRWPGFIYAQPGNFNAHANAVILYLGISYSILLASYYAPVAMLLSRAARRSGDVDAASRLIRHARVGPMNAAKVAAAIFAPALASIFSGLLDFS